MPRQLIEHGAGSNMNRQQQQSRESSRRARAGSTDSLDERIAGLVCSGALPPPPPAAPTPYDRLNARFQEIRRTRRDIGSQLHHVRHQIDSFQPVPRGKLLYLTVQQNTYREREAEMAARVDAFQDWRGRCPGIHADDMMDSSDEEEVFGRDPEPFLDCGSDDGEEEVRFHVGQGPDERVVTARVEDVEACLRNTACQRSARQARGPRRAWALEPLLHAPVPNTDFQDAVAGLQRARAALDDLGLRMAPDDSLHEAHAGNTDELAFDDDEDDDGDEDEVDHDIEEDPWSSDSDVPQPEANDNDTDPERPPGWQKFHQYFMYSCRGDVSAVTSTLRDGFQFERHVSEAWVGTQLNKLANIREQIEYLEAYLPGETGTLDRAEARLRMRLSSVFIQDTYDGKSAGQIFDIDTASDAYIEPVRPADLPATWTALLDATLLTALPDINRLETFWLENASVLQEMFEDGIGSSRKERALSLRCGQLRYLSSSEEQPAVSRERSEAAFGNDTEEPEATNDEEASA